MTRYALVVVLLLPLWLSTTAWAGGLKNRTLEGLDGRSVKLWEKKTKVAVLLFFRMGSRQTSHVFREMARCGGELRKRPVRVLGVTHDSKQKAAIKRLLARSRVAMPVVLDPACRLATELGIVAYPTLAIIDVSKGKVTRQPSRRIGLCEVFVGHLEAALGERREDRAGEDAGRTKKVPGKASRLQRFAELLLKQKRYRLAKNAITRSLQEYPGSARSHALLGLISLELKRCKEATRAFRRALELDKNEGLAREGQKRGCGK